MHGHPSVEGPTFLVEKVSKGMDVGVGNIWLCHVYWVESPWMSQCDSNDKLSGMEHPGWE